MPVRRMWQLVGLFMVVNLLLVIWARWPRPPAELRVTFLDVGQGDAAVIETPSGKTLVVDTGNVTSDGADDAGRLWVAPYLRSRGIHRIEMLLLSHPHADHIGGANTLLTRFDPRWLLDNGQVTGSPLVTRLLTTAQARRVPYRPAERGQRWDCRDGVTFHILAPTPTTRQGSINNASIVLRLEYGRTAFLFTGDAEAEEEAELVQSGQMLTCDVLKVAHHGSHTSSTGPFLEAAKPRFAVISVGARNVYGHPNRQVLERLRTQNAQVFRTDQHGAITFFSNGVTVRAETMLSGASRSQ